MKNWQKKALWGGGLVLGAAAVIGGVAMASKSTASGPTAPGQMKTLDVASGVQKAQISTRDGLTLMLPVGASFATDLDLAGTTAPAATKNQYAFSLGYFQPGQYTIIGTIAGYPGTSFGTVQTFSVQLTVTS